MLARLVVVVVIACASTAAAEVCTPTNAAGQAKCATACDVKQYDACAKLGLALINTNDKASFPRGVALIEKACAGKSALGCGGLGSLYMGGVGVPRDPVRAVKLFEGACSGGDALSCESLGGFYGQGGGADPAKADFEAAMVRAAPWYERACKMNRPAPCAFLATFIQEGVKFPNADPKRIPGLLDIACRGDVDVACKFLGDVYTEGKLVPRDTKKAAALYARSCKLGYDRGCAAAGK